MPSVLTIGGKPALIAGKLLLLSTAATVAPPVVAPSPPPPVTAPPAPSGPLSVSVAVRPTYHGADISGSYIHPMGNVTVAGATAPCDYTLSDPAGIFKVFGDTLFQCLPNPAVGTYPVTVTATEQGTGRTASTSVDLPVIDGVGVYIIRTSISNATDPGYHLSVNAAGINDFTRTWSIVDPSGRFGIEPQYWYIYFRNGTPPVGDYPITVKVTGADGVARDTQFTIHVYPEPAQTAPTFTARRVSSADVAGTVIGKLSAFNALGVYRYSLLDTAGGLIRSTVGADGSLYLASDSPAEGAHTFTARVSNGATSADATFSFTVAHGQVLPASNMTMVVPTGLTNAAYGTVVGTPTVTGMSGPVTWTLDNADNKYASAYIVEGTLTPLPLWLQDTSTGRITAARQIPARTHDLIVTASDGLNRCTRTFQVTAAWHQGPELWVGRGMAAAHPGKGYEHWSDVLPIISPEAERLPDNMMGYVIHVAWDSDPDYYACDNANGLGGHSQNYQVRHGIVGPGTIIGVPGPNGEKPRMGGFVGSAGGGVDVSGKAFMTFANGDNRVSGLEVSFVTGTDMYTYDAGGMAVINNEKGVTGVRKGGDTYGDFYVDGCYIHDCNDDIHTGGRPGNDYIRNNVLGNGGTAYVGSGATHNLYAAESSYIEFSGNLTYRTMNGHTLKMRSLRGLIENNRMFDGEMGSSSAVIDIPMGGEYVIRNNVIHKGPNAQNDSALQLIADGWQGRPHVFDIHDNTFIIQVPGGNHFGDPVAIKHFPTITAATGISSDINIHDNTAYLCPGSSLVLDVPTGTYYTRSGSRMATVSNTTLLTAPPALDFSDPTNPGHNVPHLGPYNAVQEQGIGNNYAHFYMTQIDPGTDDIRVATNAPSGTVLANLTAYGANIWGVMNATDPRINPFKNGATFSITRDLGFYPGDHWAPDGRYAIQQIDATHAKLIVNGPLVAGTDFVKVRAVAPDGTTADWRYYVSVVAP